MPSRPDMMTSRPPTNQKATYEVCPKWRFSGKLLDEVIDVLMADDNRLLQVMLEEELGLSLETYEHPLKQAAGAFFGVIGAATLLGLGLFLFSHGGVFIFAALIIALSA